MSVVTIGGGKRQAHGKAASGVAEKKTKKQDPLAEMERRIADYFPGTPDRGLADEFENRDEHDDQQEHLNKVWLTILHRGLLKTTVDTTSRGSFKPFITDTIRRALVKYYTHDNDKVYMSGLELLIEIEPLAIEALRKL